MKLNWREKRRNNNRNLNSVGIIWISVFVYWFCFVFAFVFFVFRSIHCCYAKANILPLLVNCWHTVQWSRFCAKCHRSSTKCVFNIVHFEMRTGTKMTGSSAAHILSEIRRERHELQHRYAPWSLNRDIRLLEWHCSASLPIGTILYISFRIWYGKNWTNLFHRCWSLSRVL